MKSLLKLEAAKTGGGSGLSGRAEAKQWSDDSHGFLTGWQVGSDELYSHSGST